MVFKDLDQAFDGLRQLSARRRGRFAVATSPLLAATLLPQLLASFRLRFPGIEVDLLDLPVDGIAQAVREGRADFGVCTADQEVAGLLTTTLYQDRLMLACLADHPLAGRKEVRWSELAGEPMALLRHGSGLRTLVEWRMSAQRSDWSKPVWLWPSCPLMLCRARARPAWWRCL